MKRIMIGKLKSLYLRIKRIIYYFLEIFLNGGEVREKLLLLLLKKHYVSLLKREWQLTNEDPHFEDHRIEYFLLGFTHQPPSYKYFNRAFFSASVIKKNDQMLDIGCGDGFFTKRFYSSSAKHIDAIDTDIKALKIAKKNNPGINIKYFNLNAVNDDFPLKLYNVIIWDGAIGHFTKEESRKVTEKISYSLDKNGIFVGSESLGDEGSDHMQSFENPQELNKIFKDFFKYSCFFIESYPLFNVQLIRKEIYWQCSNNINLLNKNWEIIKN